MTDPQLISEASVERNHRGAVEVRWRPIAPDLPVAIFVGDSPGTIQREHPVARVRGESHATIPPLEPSTRHYFEIQPDGGRGVVVAERKVHLHGAVNFRDLGGYKTEDGRRVRWGRIFRADHLSKLTAADHILLRKTKLKCVCDFRSPAEVEQAPDVLPGDGPVRYVHLPVRHSSLDPAHAFEKIKRGDLTWLTEEFLVRNYIESVEKFGRVWGEVFHLAAEPENLPLVFHCTGGKDRTGVCAALLLLALGVPEETVFHDYGLSDVYNASRLEEIYDRLAAFGIKPDQIRPYLTVPPYLMTATLRHIRENSGSVQQYLKNEANVPPRTIEELQRLLLE